MRPKKDALSRVAKSKGPMLRQREHWRSVAKREFPEHEEFWSDKSEEYGIYNLFFQLRGELAQAVAQGDPNKPKKIIAFGNQCLRNELASDGEDIDGAAGVSLF